MICSAHYSLVILTSALVRPDSAVDRRGATPLVSGRPLLAIGVAILMLREYRRLTTPAAGGASA